MEKSQEQDLAGKTKKRKGEEKKRKGGKHIEKHSLNVSLAIGSLLKVTNGSDYNLLPRTTSLHKIPRPSFNLESYYNIQWLQYLWTLFS